VGVKTGVACAVDRGCVGREWTAELSATVVGARTNSEGRRSYRHIQVSGSALRHAPLLLLSKRAGSTSRPSLQGPYPGRTHPVAFQAVCLRLAFDDDRTRAAAAVADACRPELGAALLEHAHERDDDARA
jgi:hypothetical protein